MATTLKKTAWQLLIIGSVGIVVSFIVAGFEMSELGGRAELAADALPADDRRAFVAGREGAVRAGLVSRGRSLSLVLETGTDAGSFVLRRFEPSQIAPGGLAGVDVLILDDIKSLSDGSLQAVVDFVRAGGGLVLVLGPNSDAAFLNGRLFPALGDLRWSRQARP